jgi:hypothetical protein
MTDKPKHRRQPWALRIVYPAVPTAPTRAELDAGIDLTPMLVNAEPPWPVVGECHSDHLPEHSCRQCDGSHDHDWVAWREPLGGLTGPGVPVRCRTCGARKCDRPDCLLRRHHRGPHELY